MGCGASSDQENSGNVSPIPLQNHQQVESREEQPSKTILEAYQQFDEEICEREGMCPGPRLASADSWIKFLQSQKSLSDNEIVQLPLHMLDNENMEEEEQNYDTKDRLNKDIYSVSKVRQLAEKLHVVIDINQSIKYEEFMARISRRYMDDVVKALREEIIEHSQRRANELLEQYSKLRALYSEQDALISSITGGTYTNEEEQKLDEELESARQIRDKLGGVAEQWHTAANLLRASAKAALVAYEQWHLISSSSEAHDKISLATECRSSILGSLTAFKCSQEALPQVDFPHITHRQIIAVGHANEYLLTDIANKDRYLHSLHVFDAYQKSLAESVKWLHDTFKMSLKKDLDVAENDVISSAKKLREFRMDYIQIRIGNLLYVPGELVTSI